MELDLNYSFPNSEAVSAHETYTNARCIAAINGGTLDTPMKRDFLRCAEKLRNGRSENGGTNPAFLSTQGIPDDMKIGSLVKLAPFGSVHMPFLWEIKSDASLEDRKTLEMMNDRLQILSVEQAEAVQKHLSALNSQRQNWAQLAAKICGDAAIGGHQEGGSNQDLGKLLTDLLSAIPASEKQCVGRSDLSSINVQVTAARAIAGLATIVAQGMSGRSNSAG